MRNILIALMRRAAVVLVAVLVAGLVVGEEVDIPAGPLDCNLREGVTECLAIPYAVPPVGELRLRPPQSHPVWTETRNARTVGPSCLQLAAGEFSFYNYRSEDCLTVNVWSNMSGVPGRPVMAFVHGGAFVIGGAGVPELNGTTLAGEHDVVVVTLNYRLGALGFLALEELRDEAGSGGTTGNYGFQDQQLALLWVRENIGAFGGDPERVFLFGQSAGSTSVTAHTTAPASAGLFSRIGAMSTYVSGYFTMEKSLSTGQAAVALTPCAGLSGLALTACLRDLDGQELIRSTAGCGYGISVDGVVLPELPTEAYLAGRAQRVPFMIGNTRNEATMTIAPSFGCKFGERAYPAFTQALFTPIVGAEAAHLPAVEYQPDEFPDGVRNTSSSYWALSSSYGDHAMLVPSMEFASLLESVGLSSYVYVFAHGPDESLNGCFLGAYHIVDVPYVFGYGDFTGAERQLSQTMQRQYAAFAHGNAPDPDWPAWSSKTRENWRWATGDGPTLQTSMGIGDRVKYWLTFPENIPPEEATCFALPSSTSMSSLPHQAVVQ
mmetsp:Transcript_11947/g.33635  ORF Transcript_11947/g.33635 Transcript_11947/m.33635 type:complete len:549 (-) Transcript_11947:201-1847(-)